MAWRLHQNTGALGVLVVLAMLLTCAPGTRAAAGPHRSVAQQAGSGLPAGFSDEVVWDDLQSPTAIRFSPDGRVVVAELAGTIKVYDSVEDQTPTVSGDEPWQVGEPPTLQVRVHTHLDRGLLGMALDPDFPREPWIYVSYAYNHDPRTDASAVPAYRTGDQDASDPCPEGVCTVEGRIGRMRVRPDGTIDTTQEQVLVGRGYCFVHPSHAMGQLEFGSDGYLYAGAGEGASYLEPDTGQGGNECGDAPGEGGSLRSQDLGAGTDPVGLDGTVIRIDPDTGAPAPGNPLADSVDPQARRIVAYGMRNPFRFTVRPSGDGGADELWIGDVGASWWEEVNRVDPAAPVENLGWPCYEGAGPYWAFQDKNVRLCERLYADVAAGRATHTAPWWAYPHDQPVLPGGGDTCALGSGSVSAVGFLADAAYPELYDGALLVGDYTRECLWMIPRDAEDELDRSRVIEFHPDAGHVVMVEEGPGGELWFVEIYSDDGPGTIHRVSYSTGNRAPQAVIRADRTSGSAPLTVRFDGTGSSDPDGDQLTYVWDLDGDRAYDDATGPRVSWTYPSTDAVIARLRVTDPDGAGDVAAVQIQPPNDAPTMVIDRPAETVVEFGDLVEFAGHATDPQDGPLPASAITWVAELQHCAPACHRHPLQTFPDTDSGSFTVPEHELPTHVELTATATDSRGLTGRDTVRLDLAAPGEEPDDPPSVEITRPAATDDAPPTYAVGRRVAFAATAVDPETGVLPASALDWTLERVRCPGGECAATVVREWSGVAEGSFRPGDQPQDATLRLSVVARDTGGREATDVVALAPRRSRQVFRSRGAVARIRVEDARARGRLVRRLVVGSSVPVVAARRGRADGRWLRFVRWSHHERRRHTLLVPARAADHVARYRR